VSLLRSFLERLSSKLGIQPFDPARFGDPLALEIDWTPLHRTGIGWTSHRLKSVGPSRLRFVPTLSSHMFPLPFLGIATYMLWQFWPRLVAWNHGQDGLKIVLTLGFIAVFGVIGGVTAFGLLRKIVFDRESGRFWKGLATPSPAGIEAGRQTVPLAAIHVLQLLSSSGNDAESSTTYELNLVRHDGTRCHVLAHSGARALREDAAKLGAFLGVPVWDAS